MCVSPGSWCNSAWMFHWVQGCVSANVQTSRCVSNACVFMCVMPLMG